MSWAIRVPAHIVDATLVLLLFAAAVRAQSPDTVNAPLASAPDASAPDASAPAANAVPVSASVTERPAQAPLEPVAVRPSPAARGVAADKEIPSSPSLVWLVGGLALGGVGLALNYDTARRANKGDADCYAALHLGGCFVEALAAGPVGTLGGLGVIFYGFWLGEHRAALDLARGLARTDQASLRTWSLIGTIGGYLIGTGINVYVIVRMLANVRDLSACKTVPAEQRAEACYGGKFSFGLVTVQNIGYGILLGSVGFLGYAQGYDAEAERRTAPRSTLVPWMAPAGHGAAAGLSFASQF